jgi:hypothetical protein
VTEQTVAPDPKADSSIASSDIASIVKDTEGTEDELTSEDQKSAKKGEVSFLLEILAIANQEIGARSATSIKIRRELRERGHKGGLRGIE